MANTLKQSFIQIGIPAIPKRIIIQYTNNKEDQQSVINYEDLTAEQKTIFDSFKTLCESIIS